MELRRRLTLSVTTIATITLAVGGCTTTPAPATKEQSTRVPLELTVTPADQSRALPVSTEIGVEVKGGEVRDVRVRDERGTPVAVEPREDGSAWVPVQPLGYRRTYTAEVTAANDAGETATRTITFTTGEKPKSPAITSTLYFADKRTYGTAMPVTVAFDPPVPADARVDVQRRLFVTTDPPQPGVWSWLADGSQVYYRAPDFWRPGTRISVRAALEGLPIGRDLVGDADRRATSTIGRHVSLEVDNATKQMSVFRDGKLLRRIPVSLGKPSTPSSSGRMVIMEKFERTTFDTRGEPNGGYVVDVDDAQRYTWGGEFIHAAPWSEGDQGHTNVSHGCTNISAQAADWLMGITQVGDLITVRGTEVEVQPGNGWTAWNVSWAEFVRGSALPVPEQLRSAPSADSAPPAAGASPQSSPEPAGTGTGG